MHAVSLRNQRNEQWNIYLWRWNNQTKHALESISRLLSYNLDCATSFFWPRMPQLVRNDPECIVHFVQCAHCVKHHCAHYALHKVLCSTKIHLPHVSLWALKQSKKTWNWKQIKRTQLAIIWIVLQFLSDHCTLLCNISLLSWWCGEL